MPTADESRPAAAANAVALPHWPEYLMEGACLGLFLISAAAFGVLLEHPQASVHQAIDSPLLRRALGGLAMGLTSVALVCSPWGRRSGAHMNPALTMTYWSLGKIHALDAWFYLAAQFLGATLGIQIADLLIGMPLRHGAVNYVVTVPGQGFSKGEAFAAEFAISCLLMLVVLYVSNHKRLSRWTPFFAGSMVALYIFLEAPVSGMSMNPARTFGSAWGANEWTALWVYFAAPLLGMLCAGQIYARCFGADRVLCAKLHHHNSERCIFRYCRFGME